MTYKIHTLPAFHIEHNYVYVLSNIKNGKCIVIDPPEADLVLDFLGDDKTLDTILLTHHHWDHTDGVGELVEKTGAKTIGNIHDSHRLPNLDLAVSPWDEIRLHDTLSINILPADGHTIGHIVYHIPTLNAVFVGDLLFVLGCGRMFEGTYEQFFNSIQIIKRLPDTTMLYIGHEYTASAIRFTESLCKKINKQDLDPSYLKSLKQKILQKQFTSPTPLAQERKNNPFMWAESVEEFKVYRDFRNTF